MITDRRAERLHAAADLLSTVDRSLASLTVPAAAFGADESGIAGRVGRELHAHWGAVLAARAQEAADVAVRLTDLADGVRSTAHQYTEADRAAADRFTTLTGWRDGPA